MRKLTATTATNTSLLSEPEQRTMAELRAQIQDATRKASDLEERKRTKQHDLDKIAGELTIVGIHGNGNLRAEVRRLVEEREILRAEIAGLDVLIAEAHAEINELRAALFPLEQKQAEAKAARAVEVQRERFKVLIRDLKEAEKNLVAEAQKIGGIVK
jgi:uncharacterized coiled-coil DUF342 family protein